MGWSRDGKMVLIDSFSHGPRSRLAVSLIELSSHRTTGRLDDPRDDLQPGPLLSGRPPDRICGSR
jgi:hypothetical protein